MSQRKTGLKEGNIRLFDTTQKDHFKGSETEVKSDAILPSHHMSLMPGSSLIYRKFYPI